MKEVPEIMGFELELELEAEELQHLVWQEGKGFVPAEVAFEHQFFTPGQLSVKWVAQAFRLPGKAGVVAMLLAWRATVSADRPVTPTGWVFEMCQVSRWALARTLMELEAAGLISVERRRGCKPRITLIGHRPIRSVRP